MSKTYEKILEEKDKREARQDPFKRLNKARIRRLEEAHFARLKEEEDAIEDRMFCERFISSRNF